MQSSVRESGEGFAPAPGLMRLATRLAGVRDAEDLVQATYLRALEHEGAIRSRSSWLRQVLVNEQRMQLRGRKRRDQREHATGVALGDAADVEDVVHCLDVARVVHELLEELDDDVRTVVRQRYFEGDTAAEIARQHALPPGTVRWRLKAGLDSLRVRLDARYGGRRALWAGGFSPLALPPTLLDGAASQPATVGGASTATAKGISAMSIKIFLAVGLVGATATGVVIVGSGHGGDVEAPNATPTTEVAAAALAPRAEPTARATAADKAAWGARRSQIQAAHANTAKPEGAPTERSWHAEGEHAGAPQDCEDEHCAAMCTGPHCLKALAAEVLGMMEGCDGFLDGVGSDMALTARVIGAPDIGTIVESVTVDSGGDTPAELSECLAEAMYTLDLGVTDDNFEQDVTVMLSAQTLDGPEGLQGLEGLDPETRAKIEAVMAAKGEHAEMRFVHLDAERADVPPAE